MIIACFPGHSTGCLGRYDNRNDHGYSALLRCSAVDAYPISTEPYAAMCRVCCRLGKLEDVGGLFDVLMTVLVTNAFPVGNHHGRHG